MKKEDIKNMEQTQEELKGEQFLQGLIDNIGLEQLQLKQKKFVQKKFQSAIPDEFNCTCSACQELHKINKPDMKNVNHFEDDTSFFEQYFKLKEKENLATGESVKSQKVINPQNANDKDYNFILKRLQTPQKLVRNIRLFIPETICYIGGEPKLFACTNYVNRTIKFNNPKEKLTIVSKREVMNDRRHQYKQYIEFKLQEREKNNDSQQQVTQENHNKEAYTVCFEIEHHDKTKKNVSVQYSSLLNETEFLLFSSKRKIDPIWQSVMYIQNYLTLKKQKLDYQRFSFKYQKQKHEYLFTRALADVQMMSGDLSWASEEYVRQSTEEQFEDKLMQISPLYYCRYMTFKIANFIETFHFIKIIKMKCEWLQDDLKNMYFMNALKVVHCPSKQAYSHNKKLQMKDVSTIQVNQEKYRQEQKKQIIDMFSGFIKIDQQNSKLSDKKFKEANKKSNLQQNLNFISKSKNPILDLKKILLQENMQNLGLDLTKPTKRPSTVMNRGKSMQRLELGKNKWQQVPSSRNFKEDINPNELKHFEKIKYSINQNVSQLQLTSSLYQRITSKEIYNKVQQIQKEKQEEDHYKRPILLFK